MIRTEPTILPVDHGIIQVPTAVRKNNRAFTRMGGVTQAGDYGSTTNLGMKVEVEGPFSRYRWHFWKESGAATNFRIASAVTGLGLLPPACTTSQFYHPVVNGVTYNAFQANAGAPGWVLGTVGGLDPWDWPNTGGATDKPQHIVTDWFDVCDTPREDGGTRPLILMRLQHDASANGALSSYSMSTWRNAAIKYPWFRELQAPNISGGGSIDDITKNGGSAGSITIWAAVECEYNTPAITVLGVGDSNLENHGTFAIGSFGTWTYQACMTASTPRKPICYVNCGRAGGTVAQYSTAGLLELGFYSPQIVVYAAGTSNDIAVDGVLDAQRLQYWKSRLSTMLTACTAAGARLICYGPLPGQAYLAAHEPYRLAMRQHCLNLQEAGLIQYLDFELILGLGLFPNRLKPEMRADGGTHISQAAAELMSAMLQRLF